MGIEALIRLARHQATPPSGLTVSGGEPTDQPEGVMALIDAFRMAFQEAEVVLYTGLPWRTLAARHPMLVALLDVAVTGPYVRGLGPTPMAGSSNQEVHLLTPLAERLYRNWQDWPIHSLQVGRGAGDQVVTVGIPDITRMEMAAHQAGATEASWNKTVLAKEWRKS
jgi:anaerobic ribonucleoside-triphosphate reductase activating protein